MKRRLGVWLSLSILLQVGACNAVYGARSGGLAGFGAAGGGGAGGAGFGRSGVLPGIPQFGVPLTPGQPIYGGPGGGGG